MSGTGGSYFQQPTRFPDAFHEGLCSLMTSVRGELGFMGPEDTGWSACFQACDFRDPAAWLTDGTI